MDSEKFNEKWAEFLDIIFLQETLCKATYDDSDCMCLYPICKIIYDKLEAFNEYLEDFGFNN